jgi:predicted amidohydrolase YtcJ
MHKIRKKKDFLFFLNEIEYQKNKLNIIINWNTGYFNIKQKDLQENYPILICSRTLHKFVINQKGKDILSREKHKEIVKKFDDPFWVEKNLARILEFLTELKGISIEKINTFFEDITNLGIWKIEDMLLPSNEVIETFLQTKHLKRVKFWVDIDTLKEIDKKYHRYIKGIKIFTDGALGSKTSKLYENYDNNQNGFLLYGNDELEHLLLKCFKINKEIAIHCIGNVALNQLSSVLLKLRNKTNYDFNKIRIEHAQMLETNSAKRFKELGIRLSMQPNFNLDSFYYTDRLEEEYLKKNNNFRMIIDEAKFEPGKDLIFSSDGMPHGIEYALYSSLFPKYDSQRLTLSEFVNGYCIDDYSKGYIEIKINYEKRKIKTTVFINKNKNFNKQTQPKNLVY